MTHLYRLVQIQILYCGYLWISGYIWVNNTKYSKSAVPECCPSISHWLASSLVLCPSCYASKVNSNSIKPWHYPCNHCVSICHPWGHRFRAWQWPPAVIVSSIRQWQRNAAPTIHSQSDANVWELTDEDIIGKLSHWIPAMTVWNVWNRGCTGYLAFWCI